MYSDSEQSPQVEIGFPEGMLGDLARFYYNNAPYPNVSVAVSAAIATLAAIFGRVCNVSNTGLNVWIAVVGETAIGKEAAQDGISKLISACVQDCPAIGEFVGPSKWASPEALHKRIARTPSVVGFVGELGIKVKSWCNPNANPVASGLVAFKLDVYGKSGRGSILQAQENSDKEKGAGAVHSPALSLLGDTTPSTLKEALDERLIANGFLPRWIFVNAGDKRGRLNKKRTSLPAPELANTVKDAAAFALAAQTSGRVVDVTLDSEAENLFDELEQFATGIINGSNQEATRHLWSRAPLNVLKVAAISAIGRTFAAKADPIIIGADLVWARQLVTGGVQHVLAAFANGEAGGVDGNQTKQEQLVLWSISQFLANHAELTGFYPLKRASEFAAKSVIPYAHIQQRVGRHAAFRNDRLGANLALKRTIQNLLDNDIIREVPARQLNELFGCKPRSFAPAHADMIIKGSQGGT